MGIPMASSIGSQGMDVIALSLYLIIGQIRETIRENLEAHITSKARYFYHTP
jgi:hypothetical protein